LLEAQRAAVETFLNGGRWTVLAEYREIESGKRADRPQLLRALQHCKVTGATLVIAKLDRLARDANFLLGLQKAGIRFVAADMPEANEMVVGRVLSVAIQTEAAPRCVRLTNCRGIVRRLCRRSRLIQESAHSSRGGDRGRRCRRDDHAREPPTADPRRVARGGAAPAAAITVVFRKGADGIVIRQLAERFPDLKIQEAALEASTDTKVSNYRKHSGLHRDTAGPNIEIAQ
jgi:hypothetical protein